MPKCLRAPVGLRKEMRSQIAVVHTLRKPGKKSFATQSQSPHSLQLPSFRKGTAHYSMTTTLRMPTRKNPLNSFMSDLLMRYGDTPLTLTHDNARPPLVATMSSQRLVVAETSEHSHRCQNRWGNASPASFPSTVDANDIQNQVSPPEISPSCRWDSLSPGDRACMYSPSLPSRKKEIYSSGSSGDRIRSGKLKGALPRGLQKLPY